MYYQKRGKNYSFVYYDATLKRNVRLPQTAHAQFQSDEEADRFCKKWDAENDAMKFRIRKRMEWSKKFFDFNELLEIFQRAKKEEAPNTWMDYGNHIQYHVFPFFLTKRNCNNMNIWHYYFEEFRDHLQSSEVLKKKGLGPGIAYSTMNNIINSLNSFMNVMYRRRFVETRHICRHFSSSLLNQRSEESVVSLELQEMVYSALRFRSELSADFFLVSLHTGMRLNEQIGISIADICADEIESDFMKKALKPYNLKPYGFISLESQPAERMNPRNEIGKVPRKPLKGKRKIDPKDCRIIPLFHKRAYNILVKLWNRQRKLYESKRHGHDLKDYLLFDGLTYSIYSSNLRLIQQKMKSDHLHSPHDTRHTYSTWLADKTGGNYTLCRMILGHHDLDMTMRYVHINAKIQRQMKCKSQLAFDLEMAV